MSVVPQFFRTTSRCVLRRSARSDDHTMATRSAVRAFASRPSSRISEEASFSPMAFPHGALVVAPPCLPLRCRQPPRTLSTPSHFARRELRRTRRAPLSFVRRARNGTRSSVREQLVATDARRPSRAATRPRSLVAFDPASSPLHTPSAARVRLRGAARARSDIVIRRRTAIVVARHAR